MHQNTHRTFKLFFSLSSTDFEVVGSVQTLSPPKSPYLTPIDFFGGVSKTLFTFKIYEIWSI